MNFVFCASELEQRDLSPTDTLIPISNHPCQSLIAHCLLYVYSFFSIYFLPPLLFHTFLLIIFLAFCFQDWTRLASKKNEGKGRLAIALHCTGQLQFQFQFLTTYLQQLEIALSGGDQRPIQRDNLHEKMLIVDGGGGGWWGDDRTHGRVGHRCAALCCAIITAFAAINFCCSFCLCRC